MRDFRYALFDGIQLLKGSLGEPLPALVWQGGEWVERHMTLADLADIGDLRPLTDREAERFMRVMRPSLDPGSGPVRDR